MRMFNLNKKYNREIEEYANSNMCILRNKLFENCNDMQLISAHSSTLFVYAARCSDDS